MPRVETAGHKRYWELKQFLCRDGDGNKHAVEGFMDMTTGKFHTPEGGWNGSPPELPPGERLPETTSDRFRENYRATFGHD